MTPGKLQGQRSEPVVHRSRSAWPLFEVVLVRTPHGKLQAVQWSQPFLHIVQSQRDPCLSMVWGRTGGDTSGQKWPLVNYRGKGHNQSYIVQGQPDPCLRSYWWETGMSNVWFLIKIMGKVDRYNVPCWPTHGFDCLFNNNYCLFVGWFVGFLRWLLDELHSHKGIFTPIWQHPIIIIVIPSHHYHHLPTYAETSSGVYSHIGWCAN